MGAVSEDALAACLADLLSVKAADLGKVSWEDDGGGGGGRGGGGSNDLGAVWLSSWGC